METSSRLLEINLISAQGLKHPPSCKLRKLQTYALVYIESSTKVRTRIDRLGAQNPTWNDRFFFKVTPDFLSGDTSAITVEIFAVGYVKDPLIGTVRTYLSNILPPLPLNSVASTSEEIQTPCFTAVQIRRPSGRFHGVLNLGAMVVCGSEFAALVKTPAMDYHHLMGDDRRINRLQRTESEESHLSSWCGGSMDFSDVDEYYDDTDDDGSGSTSSAVSSASASVVLKDLNGVRELAGKGMRSFGGGVGFLMCGLLASSQKKIHLSPSDDALDHDENHI